MKNLCAALLCLSVSAVLFCSSGPSDTLVEMQKAYRSGKKEKIQRLYTQATVDALKACEVADPDGGASVIGERLFDRDAEWVVVEEKTEGETTRVRVRYTRHSAENMRGYEYLFTLKNESGAWKVDMEREVRASAAMAKQPGRNPEKRR